MASREIRSADGLSEELVREISAKKNEPSWMLDFRLDCLKKYHKMPLPKWGPDLSGLDIEHISNYVHNGLKTVSDWAEVPEDIRETFDKLGIPKAEAESLGGVGAQYNSELVYHNLKKEASERGIVYCGIEEAMRSEHESLIREHFMQLVKPSDHKFVALHGAVWSGGSFVYVPKNTVAEFPLQSYFRFNAPGAGQFEHTLIIVDDGADLHFIEGCSAPKYNVANLHAGCVEIFVGKNARVKYSTVESWSKNMYNLNTKRAWVEAGGKIEWVSGSFGSHVSMLYPMGVLAGEGAVMEYTGISMAGEGQDLDTGAKVVHLYPNTKSYISSKSVAKDGGKNCFRSLVKIGHDAHSSKSFMNCDSLMADSKSTCDTVPVFEIECSDADVSHEASVGKISEDAINYLKTRGIKEDEARALFVRGFANDISKELPVEYAIEMNNFIKMEMGGKL